MTYNLEKKKQKQPTIDLSRGIDLAMFCLICTINNMANWLKEIDNLFRKQKIWFN